MDITRVVQYTLFAAMGLAFAGVIGLVIATKLAGSHRAATTHWGYVDARGDTVVPARFEAARAFSEGLAPVQIDGRWGYIDPKGELVIPARFRDAEPFAGGRALVRDVETGKAAYIDRTGELVTAPELAWGTPFADERAVAGVEVGRKLSRVSESQPVESLGILGLDGQWRVEPREMDDPERITQGRTPSEGRIAVAIGDRWGFLDLDGAQAIAFNYSGAEPFSEGLAAARTEQGWGYVDRDGGWVIQPRYALAGRFSDGVAPVQSADGVRFVDRTGATAFEGVYDEALPFVDGYAAVRRGSSWGLIDRQGRSVLAPQWPRVGEASASEGHVVAASTEGAGLNYKWGLVAPDGSRVGDRWFEEVDPRGLSEGLAAVRVRRD